MWSFNKMPLRGHYTSVATEPQTNDARCWYMQCALAGGFCNGLNCPAYVHGKRGYECSVGALQDAVDALHAEILTLRAELENQKHHTMRGGW